MRHPNIIHVLDFIEENNTYYYFMDFVDGEDVSHYMNGKPLALAESISIAINVANALNYMHEQHKMLHLDLKPGNIMRRKDGHIFLIDFELSKHYSDDGVPDTSTTIGLGTEGYAPLEQGKRSTKQNLFRPTIDVYALGGTLFKMLTGETPPSASDILEDDSLLEEIMTMHKIPDDIQSVITSAMMPIVKMRTPSINALLSQLKGLLPNQVDEITDNVIIETKEIIEEVGETTIMINEDTSFGLPRLSSIISKEECVDLGLSVKWRNCNLGANTSQDFGDFYQWGEIPDSITQENHITDEAYAYLQYAQNDVSQMLLGSEWSTPTLDQFKELMEKCNWVWVETQEASGYKVTGRNGNSIFLPAAGKMFMDRENYVNQKGYYWIQTNSNDYKCVNYLYFDESDIDLCYEPYVIRQSIRPVYKEPK